MDQRIDLYVAFCTKNIHLLFGLYKLYYNCSSNSIKKHIIIKSEKLIKTLGKLYDYKTILNIVLHFIDDCNEFVFKSIEYLTNAGEKPNAYLASTLIDIYNKGILYINFILTERIWFTQII